MSIIRASSSAVHQEHHNVEASLEGGDMRRRPAVSICLPDIGARVDEQLDHLRVSHQTGVREKRLTIGIEAVDARLDTREGRRRESLQQRIEQSQIALRNGLMQERVTNSGWRRRRSRDWRSERVTAAIRPIVGRGRR